MTHSTTPLYLHRVRTCNHMGLILTHHPLLTLLSVIYTLVFFPCNFCWETPKNSILKERDALLWIYFPQASCDCNQYRTCLGLGCPSTRTEE